eukprot:12299649-Alexandrium_andersonii.AAC.1
MSASLVGSEMCIRDSPSTISPIRRVGLSRSHAPRLPSPLRAKAVLLRVTLAICTMAPPRGDLLRGTRALRLAWARGR